MKTAYFPKEIPKTDHYAVISGGSIHIPGDERSRIHPGHGYPESTEYIIKYSSFETYEELMAYLNRLSSDERSKIRVLNVKPCELQERVEITLK